MIKLFHKNPQIAVEDGKIIQLIMEDVVIESNFDFSSTVQNVMRELSISSPLAFMELYLNLSNDEEFLKKASEIYEDNIDKLQYPYEVMKSLYMSDLPEKPYNASASKFFIDMDLLLIVDGLVIKIIDSISNSELVKRNEILFYSTLKNLIYHLADSKIVEFMKFYKVVKNDPVAFKIADNVRKILLEAKQEKLNKIQSEIDLLSCT